MRRIDRDYCGIGNHPKGWRLWRAEYKTVESPIESAPEDWPIKTYLKTSWLGNFCENCGANVTPFAIGSGWPKHTTRCREIKYKGRIHTLFTRVPKLP